MENEVISLGLYQMVAAYLFVLILLAIVRLKKIPREKEIIISALRMSLQLVIMGYVLIFIFENEHPVITLLIILVMEAFAINNIYKRSKIKLSYQLKKIIAISMLVGTLTSIFFFILIVINVSPWYDPQYFIPISGMMIGNSMTGITLGVERLADGMNSERESVETYLMLGARPDVAARRIINNSFESAILPTINNMMGMGIIFLPGMMTGQILAGVVPTTAIAYQIAIMLAVLGGVSLTVISFVQLGYKTFFNERNQLIW
ncbi:ABC transporter permease [Natranaerobius trueperi]|uniref:Iron export ABC transporter permease subunit FetB n=1 Tax=Natranaerobius trueperi TaxID=759412 RepID=A0A226C1R5_9FIRM|nr:iron export ABC transporter permease subunit FetB [Natranaerobius trueperi]OWZ84992.1 iron export ABC transporter permease subunit FetB [Natranaerobius trueperi]